MLKTIQNNDGRFGASFQGWYTKAVRIVQVLAPDRLAEFKSYYEEEPKRKTLSSVTYRIRDFVRGIRPARSMLRMYDDDFFEAADVTRNLFQTQMLLLESLSSRIDGIIAELESAIAHGIQDAEIDSAQELKKVNLRASGALAGVVLESHLQKVAAIHSVAIPKKNPTIGDLNEPLKKAGVYEIATYRKIQLLADIRNICTHQKGKDPTPDQIDDMLNGVRSIVKLVF